MSVLSKLNPRERVLVLGGGTLLICLGLWMYVWQPLQVERAVQSDRIARYLAMIDIAENADVSSDPIPAAPKVQTPLPPRITQSAEAAGILLARLDPDGPRLRVTVAKGAYETLITWISDLEATSNLRVLSVEMSRLTELGQVSLRLMVEDAG